MAKRKAGLDQLAIALEGIDNPTAHRGAVYRGVNRQVTALVRAGRLDLDLEAGTIAQARKLAGVIDVASGLGGHKLETYALPQLNRELRELLGVLSGRTPAGSDLSWLEDDPPGDELEQRAADDAAR